MKKWRNKIPYFIFLIGVGLDIGVNITGKYLFSVTESYMDSIFAAIITVSVLCFSFVALISSFLERVYLGYKLRDIIQFKNSPINIKKYITISLCAICVGILLLSGNFVLSCANSLLALLVALVWIEGDAAFVIYDMITNEKYLNELVRGNFSLNVECSSMDLEEFHTHTDKVIAGLRVCINDNDAKDKEKVCDMMVELGSQIKKRKGEDDYYKYYNYFNDKVRGCIDSFARTFGFNELINLIVKVYTSISDFEYGRIDLYIIPIRNMRYWSDQQLLEYNYFDQLKEIDLLEVYKEKKVTNSEVERILYEYFDNIMHNCICTKDVKKQLIERYMAELLKLYWKTNSNGIEPDINNLLNILRYYVLKNYNKEEREYVFKVIVRQIFYNNSTYEKKKYFDFLSFFFQAFYAYTMCETETLNEKYRQGLLKTFNLEFSSASIAKMSTSLLIRIDIKEILFALGRRIIHGQDSLERRFENFPEYSMAKTVVWTQEFNITYMFMLYLIFYDEVGFYSIYSVFLQWDEINDNEKKIQILEHIQNKFDMTTGLLKKAFVDQCQEYEKVLNHHGNISDENQKNLFDYISKEYTKLKKESLNQHVSLGEIKYRDVLKEIDELMQRNNVFGWKLDCSMDTYIKFFMPYCISRKKYRTSHNTARAIQGGILQAFQRYIQQHSKELILTFDLNGIIEMKSFIQSNTYDARNYTFTEDWALARFREEKEFVSLEKEQEKIELINTPQIYENLFFVKDKFCFSAKISDISFEDLTEKECADFLEDSKCYNGLYNVDGALMSKEEAIEFVKKIYCKERYGFKLILGFNKEDVAHIKFKH